MNDQGHSLGEVGTPKKRIKIMDTFDYVIVGAGSAGCVLANRLSEEPAAKICVLEAGPRDWHPYIHLPSNTLSFLR